MADSTIRPDLMEKLQAISERENRPVDEVLESLLSHYKVPDQIVNDAPRAGTMAKLAEMGRQMNFEAAETDIASRSREILQEEWEKHLRRNSTGDE